MNILFLTYQGDLAGSTRSIFYLADGLANRGHNIYVGCRKGSLLNHLLKDSKAITINMKFKGRFDISNIKLIKRIVSSKDIDIINAQSSYDRYTSILAKKLFKLPVKIVHTRRQRPRSDGGWLQRKFYILGTDAIIVVSDELKKMFISNGYPEDHVHVIYNGIPSSVKTFLDHSIVENLKNEYGLNKEDVVIGCVSRKKSQEELIKALKYLDPAWIIIFVGIERDYVQKSIEQDKVRQRLIFAGVIDFKATLNHYKLFDVNVLPSRMDGFGLAIVESMMMGTPVVGANMGGIKNVIEDGISGLLYEFGAPEDLADKIRYLMEDEERRNRIIRSGYQRAMYFDIERTVDEYEKYFESLPGRG